MQGYVQGHEKVRDGRASADTCVRCVEPAVGHGRLHGNILQEGCCCTGMCVSEPPPNPSSPIFVRLLPHSYPTRLSRRPVHFFWWRAVLVQAVFAPLMAFPDEPECMGYVLTSLWNATHEYVALWPMRVSRAVIIPKGGLIVTRVHRSTHYMAALSVVLRLMERYAVVTRPS